MVGGVEYSAELMNTDTKTAGEYAGKVFNVYTAADDHRPIQPMWPVRRISTAPPSAARR